jgi:hypothetical protein
MAKLLIAAGAVLILLGLLSYVLPLFRLPGDIRYEGEHFKFYFPAATCIVISIILSILFYLYRK